MKCYSALGLNAPLTWSHHHRPNKNMVYNCLIICDQLLETGVIYCNYTTDITSAGFSFVVQGHYPKVLSCATLSSVTDLHRLEILYNRKFVWNSQGCKFSSKNCCFCKFSVIQILQLQHFIHQESNDLTLFFFYIPMETLYNWRSLLNLQWSGATLWLPLIFCLPPFCCTDPSKHRLNPTPECAVVSAPKC